MTNAKHFAENLAEKIFNVLPQTQCTRCGFPDCQAYANAIAHEGAAINQRSPGGAAGIERLSNITGQAFAPLNPDNGIEGPRCVAFVDENWCIGCTLCIEVCPTDAIIGSNKLMHTVIEPHCTGCELCIPVCPVDCIELENVTGTSTGWAAWSSEAANHALKRYTIHSTLGNNYASHNQKTSSTTTAQTVAVEIPDKSAVIAAALVKARALKENLKANLKVNTKL